jgi:hypothetical protein
MNSHIPAVSSVGSPLYIVRIKTQVLRVLEEVRTLNAYGIEQDFQL